MNTAKSAALVSLLANMLLVGLKLAVGLYIGSISVLSDALDSGMDLVGAFIALFAIRLAAQPADHRHPYGHGKVESLSAIIEGSLILVGALLIFREAIQRIQTGAQPDTVSLGIIAMAVSVGINVSASLYLRKVARRTGSPALEATAWHRASDILTSLAVLTGLLIIQFTPWKSLDPVVAILVATFVASTAVRVFGRAARDLIDTSLPDEEEAIVHDILRQHQWEFVEYHNLRTRRSGSFREIDLHLVMPRTTTVGGAHNLTDRIETAIEQRLLRSMTTIHVEPCEVPQQVCDLHCLHGGTPYCQVIPASYGDHVPTPTGAQRES